MWCRGRTVPGLWLWLWLHVLLHLLQPAACPGSQELHVLWLAPSDSVKDSQGLPMVSEVSSLALFFAMTQAQSQGLLGDRVINQTRVDSACDAQQSLGELVTFLRDYPTPDLLLGPPCTEAMVPVADLASYYNLPVFSWLANEHVLDNKTRAATLVRTLPPLSGLGNLTLDLCRDLGWQRVAIVSTEGALTEGIASFLQDAIDSDDFFLLARHFSNVNASASTERLRDIMATLRGEARIIILIIPNEKLREYLLAAHDQDMTSGDFQFLYSAQTVRPERDLDILRSESMWRRNDSRDDDARQAYRNLLYMTFSFILHYENQTEVVDDNSDDGDVYARFLYDAFYLFALAYNDTVSVGKAPTGRNIFSAVQNITFDGQSGLVQMDPNSDRLPSYIIWDMRLDDTFKEVLRLSYFRNHAGRWVSVIHRTFPGIYWGNGMNELGDNYVPSDIPDCGFDNEFCSSDDSMTIVIAVVLCVVMLAAVIVFFLMYRWWKKEQELYRRNWRVKWTQLNFTKTAPLTSAMMQSKMSGSQTSFSDNASEQNPSGVEGGSALSTLLARSGGRANQYRTYSYCRTARLGDTRVAVRMIRKKNIRSDRKLLEEMRVLTTVKHVNLASFHGVCTDPPNLCVLWEYCCKGSIQDLFLTSRCTDYKLDSMILISMATDVCAGLAYLHGSEVKVHGNLKSGNCLVDNRWTCKLAGFGQSYLLKGEKALHPDDDQAAFAQLLWTAPEVLRLLLKGEPHSPTQAADMYALAILLKEILCRNEAYEDEIHVKGLTPKDIVSKVSEPPEDTLFRPALTDLPDEPASVVYSCVHLIHASWQEDPALRPTARKLLRHIRKLNPYKTYNILDNMVQMMERYSTRLEELVAERTSQLEDEKRKTDALLYRMLPQKVADDLKRGEQVQAEAFASVTVYFSDIVGFTQIASHSTPMEIVDFLNSLYTVYDDIIREYDVYKVETIGDAYMVVSGIPIPNGTRHVAIMADMALALLQAVFDFVIPHIPETQLRIRIGLNTGPVVAGVVGTMMPRYCLFGDTVNLASRMESHGVPLKIHLSPYTYDVIKDYEEYTVAERGEIEVKGKGRMVTYFLEGKMTSQTTESAVAQGARNTKDYDPPSPSIVDLHRSVEGASVTEEDHAGTASA